MANRVAFCPADLDRLEGFAAAFVLFEDDVSVLVKERNLARGLRYGGGDFRGADGYLALGILHGVGDLGGLGDNNQTLGVGEAVFGRGRDTDKLLSQDFEADFLRFRRAVRPEINYDTFARILYLWRRAGSQQEAGKQIPLRVLHLTFYLIIRCFLCPKHTFSHAETPFLLPLERRCKGTPRVPSAL